VDKLDDGKGDRTNNEISSASRKRKFGIPTGHVSENFVMGELLRRGYDAQLAKNTKGHVLLVRRSTDGQLRKVHVNAVRTPPWYVKLESFDGDLADQVTVYVLIGPETALKPIRYFVAKNRDLAARLHRPSGWDANAFLRIKALKDCEDKWDAILP